VREFANQKALVDYAERNGLVYLWEGMPAFARGQRMLSPLTCPPSPSVSSCSRQINTRLWMYARPVVA